MAKETLPDRGMTSFQGGVPHYQSSARASKRRWLSQQADARGFRQRCDRAIVALAARRSPDPPSTLHQVLTTIVIVGRPAISTP